MKNVCGISCRGRGLPYPSASSCHHSRSRLTNNLCPTHDANYWRRIEFRVAAVVLYKTPGGATVPWPVLLVKELCGQGVATRGADNRLCRSACVWSVGRSVGPSLRYDHPRCWLLFRRPPAVAVPGSVDCRRRTNPTAARAGPDPPGPARAGPDRADCSLPCRDFMMTVRRPCSTPRGPNSKVRAT